MGLNCLAGFLEGKMCQLSIFPWRARLLSKVLNIMIISRQTEFIKAEHFNSLNPSMLSLYILEYSNFYHHCWKSSHCATAARTILLVSSEFRFQNVQIIMPWSLSSTDRNWQTLRADKKPIDNNKEISQWLMASIHTQMITGGWCLFPAVNWQHTPWTGC